MKAVTDRKIICPYCFKEFEHDQVHFRLETVKNDGYDLSDIEHESDIHKKEEIQQSMYFQPKDDKDYSRFWSGYGATTEHTTTNERMHFGCEVYQLPIIDPSSSEARHCLRLQDHGNGQSDYFLYDGYGSMVQGVEDIYGAISHRRVCPYCHNPLPNGYGKNTTKFISIIGVTGSGKTVYISQLLKNMAYYSYYLVNMPTYTKDDRVDNFVNNNLVKRNCPLPDLTVAGSFLQPMTYDIVKSNGEHETIFLYEIPSDNYRGDFKEKYREVVAHTDGIIFVISPQQMGFIENSPYNNIDDIESSLETINTIYDILPKNEQGKCEIPIAVCISKSDVFADSLGVDEDNGEEIVEIATSDVLPSEDPLTGKTIPAFNATQYNVIQKRLTKMLERVPLARDLQREYKYYNYFTFSALGCGVSPICSNGMYGLYPDAEPQPIRIFEPLLWLYKRFGYIASNVPIRLPALSKEEYKELLYVPWYKKILDRLKKQPETYPPRHEWLESLWYEHD